MKKQFGIMVMVSIGVLLLFFSGTVMLIEKGIGESSAEDNLVILNEISQLTSSSEGENPAQKEIEQLSGQLKEERAQGGKIMARQMAAVCLMLTVLCLLCWSVYLYLKILKPFDKDKTRPIPIIPILDAKAVKKVLPFLV